MNNCNPCNLSVTSFSEKSGNTPKVYFIGLKLYILYSVTSVTSILYKRLVILHMGYQYRGYIGGTYIAL